MILEIVDKLALALVLYMQVRMMREQRAQANDLRKMDESVKVVSASLRPRRYVHFENGPEPYDPDKTPKD